VWAEEYPDCVGRMFIDPGVQTFLLCFCIISACQALYFVYLNLPQYQAGGRVRASWEYVAIPVVEAIVYGLNSTGAHVGYMRLFNGRAVVWLRTAHWALTIPLLLMQIGKMHSLKFYGHDINSIQIWVGILMVVFGFSASLAEVEGIKWMFFFFALLCLIVIFLSVYKIMSTAGQYYISLNSKHGSHTAMRIRILMICFFVSWSGYPLFWLLGVEGACVLGESVVSVCMAVLDCFAKNVFGMVMWDTLWNSELNGRWTCNAEAMALEMDPLPDKDGVSSSDSPHDVPYAEDGDGIKQVAADVVVRPVRPGSVTGMQKGSRIGAVGSRPGSAVPMETPPYPVIVYAATQKDAELAQSQVRIFILPRYAFKFWLASLPRDIWLVLV
jgi:bacteriorhodopsin